MVLPVKIRHASDFDYFLRQFIIMHEKLPSPAKSACIETHHFPMVVFSLLVEEADIHEFFSNSNCRKIQVFLADLNNRTLGVEQGFQLVSTIIFFSLSSTAFVSTISISAPLFASLE